MTTSTLLVISVVWLGIGMILSYFALCGAIYMVDLMRRRLK